jgi:hypothetical protein
VDRTYCSVSTCGGDVSEGKESRLLRAGSLIIVCAAVLTGGCLYALAARGLRIGEFRALTAALRAGG